jgi:hypothetical protein
MVHAAMVEIYHGNPVFREVRITGYLGNVGQNTSKTE